MTKKTFWLCDLVGISGGCILLLGIYLTWDLAAMLIISGLILMAYAARISYMLKNNDT